MAHVHMHCGPPFPVITSLLAAHPLLVYTHPNLSCCPHLHTHSHTHRRDVLLSFLQQSFNMRMLLNYWLR